MARCSVVKLGHVGLLGALMTVAFAGSFLAVWHWNPLQNHPPVMASAASSAAGTSSAPALTEVPAASASAVSSAELVPQKPTRCPSEPKVELRRKDVPPSDQELFRFLQENPELLGSASVGKPTRGSLFGGVELRESEGIAREGAYGWGTELVIRSIERAVREVRRCFPETPKLRVGDISRDKGGWLRPHASHQSGLDVDVGYYYRVPAGWYEKATAKNLDLPRTWALVRAFVEGGNVDTIFMDLAVQRVVKAYVATLPNEEQPVEEWFQSPTKKDTTIRHAWGHATHFHVRFRDPDAEALGERIKGMLPRIRKVKPRKP